MKINPNDSDFFVLKLVIVFRITAVTALLNYSLCITMIIS